MRKVKGIHCLLGGDLTAPNVDFYEVVVDYYPGSPGSYHEPPDGAEVSAPAHVEVTYLSGLTDVLTWDTMVLDVAVARGLTVDDADTKIAHKLVELAEAELAEDYDG